jgi:hypothetical protein
MTLGFRVSEFQGFGVLSLVKSASCQTRNFDSANLVPKLPYQCPTSFGVWVGLSFWFS